MMKTRISTKELNWHKKVESAQKTEFSHKKVESTPKAEYAQKWNLHKKWNFHAST